MTELKELLMARQYPEPLINKAIDKAKKIPRKIALLKVHKKITENRPIFALNMIQESPQSNQ